MSYKIIRFFQRDDVPKEVVATGLTLEEAQEHCHDPETNSRTCEESENVARTEQCGDWFDGYTEDW